ncbi:hypothetical protein BFJ70_g4021 [Fusarium oxysporum]|nr:hypothetical protein FOWG_10652 [Fusarium oxysporum f. sp. lycopersici MN25]KAJ4113833.1 hypothetical protein NW765_011440 [Fusarium oxysporum]KAJ4278842.1 hypothetical protein NW764_006200 [Fusarium oxysporum]RKL43706.1 hypothetical protein BFJ70_g4021 [Fusarium oxysporum]
MPLHLGSVSNPYAIDRDGAKFYMKAAAAEDSSVRKFLFILFLALRSARAPWWSEEQYRQHLSEKSSFSHVQAARLEADEYLVALAHSRALRGGSPFQAISLRPTWLTDSPGAGRVQLGKAGAVGNVAREDVAHVAIALLLRDDIGGWYDLFQGDTPIQEAVDAVVKNGIDAVDGEDLGRIYRLVA